MDEHNARIEELLAKEEIRETIYRIARGTDRQDGTLIRSGYHPDAIDDHGVFRKCTGYEFADRVEKRQRGSSQHCFGQINIEIKGNVACSEAYAQCHIIAEATDTTEERDYFHGVRYLDRFEKRGGGPWLIAYRLVCWDWAFYIPASAKWRMPDTVVWGSKGRQDPSYHIAGFPLKRG